MADERSLEYQLRTELGIYSAAVAERIDRIAAETMRRIVERTRATAPRGARTVRRKKDEGRPHLYLSIASKKRDGRLGESVYVWYVQSPNSWLAHLVEKGHRSRNGGFVQGAHFLQQALDAELPRMEAEIKEAAVNADQ